MQQIKKMSFFETDSKETIRNKIEEISGIDIGKFLDMQGE